MPRLRRHLPPLLLLLPVIFICGKLLLTDVKTFGLGRERGWPWVYQVEGLGDSFPVSFWPLAADIAVLSLTLAAIFALFVWQQRRAGSLLRFSLRGMLLLTAAVALLLGWWTSHARQFAHEEKDFDGFAVFFHPTDRSYCGPSWALRILPDSLCKVLYHRIRIQIKPQPASDGPFSELPRDIASELIYFANLQEAMIGDYSEGTDDRRLPLRFRENDLVALAHVPKLFIFGVAGDDGTIQSVAKLPGLQSLRLQHCIEVTDAGLAELSKLRELNSLEIVICPKITDTGIRRFAELPNLDMLHLHLSVQPSAETLALLSRKIPILIVNNKVFPKAESSDNKP